jgi:hypothetical protein
MVLFQSGAAKVNDELEAATRRRVQSIVDMAERMTATRGRVPPINARNYLWDEMFNIMLGTFLTSAVIECGPTSSISWIIDQRCVSDVARRIFIEHLRSLESQQTVGTYRSIVVADPSPLGLQLLEQFCASALWGDHVSVEFDGGGPLLEIADGFAGTLRKAASGCIAAKYALSRIRRLLSWRANFLGDRYGHLPFIAHDVTDQLERLIRSPLASEEEVIRFMRSQGIEFVPGGLDGPGRCVRIVPPQ